MSIKFWCDCLLGSKDSVILCAIFRCKNRNLQERGNTEDRLMSTKNFSSGRTAPNHLKNCYALPLWRVVFNNNYQFACWQLTFSSPSRHLLEILLSLLPFTRNLACICRNHWSVGWFCYPASLCYILDFLGSGTLVPLSIRTWRWLCIVFSVFDDYDGHKRGQTSRLVVGAEIPIVTEAHVYYCNCL